MIAFEVFLNGEKLCTVGWQDLSVLTAILNWRQLKTDDPLVKLDAEDLRFYVGGLSSVAEGNREFLRWVDRPLKVGDEVKIEIVDTDTVDAPYMREK